jgi:hypothetical protein
VQTGETGICTLVFVVANERVDRREVDRGGEVNGVQSTQDRLLERASSGENRAIDWQQRDGIEELLE